MGPLLYITQIRDENVRLSICYTQISTSTFMKSIVISHACVLSDVKLDYAEQQRTW